MWVLVLLVFILKVKRMYVLIRKHVMLLESMSMKAPIAFPTVVKQHKKFSMMELVSLNVLLTITNIKKAFAKINMNVEMKTSISMKTPVLVHVQTTKLLMMELVLLLVLQVLSTFRINVKRYAQIRILVMRNNVFRRGSSRQIFIQMRLSIYLLIKLDVMIRIDIRIAQQIKDNVLPIAPKQTK